ncbi:virion structural protein [Erwinia phage vB_EamM_ChrisDB]|uniref:virion structural protein n=1 Tax=Erwinia phage vB_EamM_ChrisDB TaxID=1883371 RepID=UPI00081C3DD7|nr:virion structural protein [Erwinia phage vB_EamM_ChrisDB]ANZ48822.1 hypothetical protein CHRISDB_260 [Erwinia phage vB_EamM_ChrisDB]
MSLFGKTAKELVYDLLVSKNPLLAEKNVTIDKLIFDTPSHIGGSDTTPEEKYGRLNTSLKVSGDTDQNVIGDVELNYRRIFLDHLFDGMVLSVDGTGATTTLDLLPKIEEKYGIILQASEVKSQPVSGSKVTVTMNGSSLVWIGNFDIFLTDMPADTTDLTAMAKVTELEGLAYSVDGIGPITPAE